MSTELMQGRIMLKYLFFECLQSSSEKQVLVKKEPREVTKALFTAKLKVTAKRRRNQQANEPH